MSILDRIVAAKQEEIAQLRPRWAEFRRAAESASAGRDFASALRRGAEIALVGEVKRRSPSAGQIRPDLQPAEVAREYGAAGVAAVSVLTDSTFFGANPGDLRAVRKAVSLPVLRKDFVLDVVQVWEARAAGADALLLIVRILDDALLAELIDLAGELGMDALVEVHDARELDRAVAAEARVVGVNSRDLATFRTELDIAVELAGAVSPDRILVAESGIRGAADVDRLGVAGVDAALVGESLMRARDVRAAAAALVGRPRDAAARAATYSERRRRGLQPSSLSVASE